MITGGSEGLRIFRAVKRIGEEHATKKHDLGDQENPHAERSRLALLLHILEMVLQCRMVGSVFRRDVGFSQVFSLSLFA